MSFADASRYAVFIAVVTALVLPIGRYLERVFSGVPTALDPIMAPLERVIYRLARVDARAEMTAAEYGVSFALFGLVGTLLLYAILRLQRFLPWFFPEFHTTALSPDLSFNIAVSFSTTTTWRAYGGENTMTYVGQMVGLCAQNCLAAAAGLAVGGSTLAAVVTSNAATGSYNSMHDSYTPLGGMVLLLNMLLGEVVFGGLGTGLSSMVMAALIAVFLAGLMIGRTPEYLGKKIGPAETKMIVIYAIVAPLAILPPAAVAVVTRAGLTGLTTNSGPHGLTEIVFAYASSFANNGQTFAGLSANSPFYNLTTAAVMLAGRFGLAVPALALAGLVARQGKTPVTIGILRTDRFAFAVLLVGSLLIMTALSYLSALALGPVLEHLGLHAE